MVARTQSNNSPMPQAEYHHAVAADISQQLADIVVKVVTALPRNREHSLCITKLEEAMFWLQRGTMQPPQKREDG
jgi:hypothetical protein